MQFPTELPTAELKNLFDFVRGNSNNLTKAVVIESAWWVVGYGLSITIATNPGFVMSGTCQPDDLESCLKPLMENQDGLQAIDWAKIIKAIMAAIASWTGN